MTRSTKAANSHSRIPVNTYSDEVKGPLERRQVRGGDELSDNELTQVRGGASIFSILSGWGKTINPFDGTVGGSDDWGKTVDPFKD